MEFDYLAVFPSVAQGTGAAVGAQAVDTHAVVQARLRVAFIDLVEAEGAGEAHRAQAREGVHPIDARATVETGAEKQTGRVTSATRSGASDLVFKKRGSWNLRCHRGNYSEHPTLLHPRNSTFLQTGLVESQLPFHNQVA